MKLDPNADKYFKGILGKTGDDTYQVPRIDSVTHFLVGIDGPHEQIHGEDSFTAYYTITTASTNGHRSGLYILTPSVKKLHAVISFSASTAAIYSICEAPTIAANTGTHGVVPYNRFRSSIETTRIQDNATVRAINRYTTLNEAEIAGDGTWNTGTVIRTEPLRTGDSPKPAGGTSRDTQEYVLLGDTAYVFLITNTTAAANTHHILLDWYEIIKKEA